jgi:hypothetical protein
MTSAKTRFAFLLVASLTAVPMFGAIAPELTLPVGGFLRMPNDLRYTTEITLTNHRDVLQYVLVEIVANGFAERTAVVPVDAHRTVFSASGFMATSRNRESQVGAFRFTAIKGPDVAPNLPVVPDPAGQLEVSSYIIAEHGEDGFRGSSRQEVAAIPSSEYALEEMVFVGVRHDAPTYTNVGIVNLHPTQSEKFYVQYQFLEPIEVTVPPLSSRQIRIPGPGNGGRRVTVYPEWSIGDTAPTRTSPWVAYASTVDGYTGDAFSGTRVPATAKVRP